MTMGIYAQDTSVSVERSRSEIEKTLARYGASAFAYGYKQNMATVQFEAENRRIRFELSMPDPTADEFTKGGRWGTTVHPDNAARKWEQSCRQKWRALSLAIKAKLEAVESGISAFEDEFMAHIVLPNGRTVGEVMTQQIQQAYDNKKMPPLLGYTAKED